MLKGGSTVRWDSGQRFVKAGSAFTSKVTVDKHLPGTFTPSYSWEQIVRDIFRTRLHDMPTMIHALGMSFACPRADTTDRGRALLHGVIIMDRLHIDLDICAKIRVYLNEFTPDSRSTVRPSPEQCSERSWQILVVERPEDWFPQHWSDEPPRYRILLAFRRRNHSRARSVIRHINQQSLEDNGRTWAIIR